MNEKVLTARPSILHDDVRRYVDNLADDVELTQTVSASMDVRDSVKLSTVPVADLADRLRPVIHETAPLASAIYRTRLAGSSGSHSPRCHG